MKKYLSVLIVALVMCLGLVGCSGGEDETENKEPEKSVTETEEEADEAGKSHDFTDETKIIYGDFTDETFQKEGGYHKDGETLLVISGDSLTEGQKVCISITVRHESDLKEAENAMKDEAKSYPAAVMPAEENLNRYGIKGCRIAYQDGNDDMGSWVWNDIFTKQPEGAGASEGCLIYIESLFYLGDEELVTYQLDRIGFNWDDYLSLKE